MAKKSKAAFVVFQGRKTGIVRSWAECEKRVKGFSNADYRKYTNVYYAEQAWNTWLVNMPPEKPEPQVLKLEPIGSSKFNSRSFTAGAKRTFDCTDLTLPADEVQPDLKKHCIYPESNENDSSEMKVPVSLVPTPGDANLNGLGPLKSPYFGNKLKGYSEGDLSDAMRRTEEAKSRERDDFERDESIILTREQQSVVDMALKGHNIFLTGAAGSGKTATLRKILSRFRQKGVRYQVVAPTGIAALALNGKTIHSFMGWRPDSLSKPLRKLMDARNFLHKVNSIEKIDAIIIEEISMVENQFLERMNLVLGSMMNSPLPLGGKQVIILGDFYQLPPVKPFEYCLLCGRNMSKLENGDGVIGSLICGNERCPLSKKAFSRGDHWAFKAPVWKELNLCHVKLDQIHRQKEGRFQDILNKVRNGIFLSDEEWNQMEASKAIPKRVCPVKLMSRKRDVDACNMKSLAAIRYTPRSWRAIDSCWKVHSDSTDVDLSFPDQLEPWKSDEPFQNHQFSEDLTLKVGAKVVLLINLAQTIGLVNGSQGEVVGFKQVGPEGPEEDRKGSRWEKEKKLEWYRQNNSEPIVRFANGIQTPISVFASVSRKGTYQNPYMACRLQIPLALAWALTIHKSQGMTLEYVEVSKQHIFEAGQLYVALSRATKIEGLILTGYDREQLAGDPDVVEFYENTIWNTHVT